MSAPACRRLWEPEAARDGRISGTALAAVLAHASRCKHCSREQQALEELATALARSSITTDELAHQRAREQLLELAAAGTYAKGSGLRWWFALAAAAIFLLSGIVLSRSLDGVIEDIGTVFRVTVHDGRTREIAVHEGAVDFRRLGVPPLLVSSPSIWAEREQPRRPQARPVEPASAPAADVAPKPRSRSPLRAAAARRQSTQSAPSSSPTDEDFAFLRIVALRREGRFDEARLAAAEYLGSFPDGFRRADVLAFVRGAH